ncbi:MAG: hypothetical protein K6G31_13420 [Paludibacteraceae bacterium]|nr:hypothetical protein [Paludibacteraceae bacterium]
MTGNKKTSGKRKTAQADFSGVIGFLSHFHPVFDCADDIMLRLTRVYLPQKTVILKPDQIANCVFFIEDGTLKSSEMRGDKEYINWILMGPAFAHNGRAFHTQSPCVELVDAVEPSVVSFLNYDDLYYLIEKHHSFAVCMFKLLGHITSMREINFSLMMSTPDLEIRVRRIAMIYPGLLSRVPLRLLALYMRMTPETLSRIVNKPEFADLKNKQDK